MSVQQLTEARSFPTLASEAVGRHVRVAWGQRSDETEGAPHLSDLLGAIDANFAMRMSACLVLVACADDAMVGRLERALEAGPVAFDVELHRSVGNPVVWEMASLAREAWRQRCAHIGIDPEASQHRAEDEAVLDAIRSGDSEELFRLLTEHRLAVHDRVRGENG